MAEPFIGQIYIVGFNFAPRGFATCDGQLLPIAQNTALFSLLGTIYGGNGQVTFALPDLRGRFPTHQGQGPGLSDYSIGQVAGEENHTLMANEMPLHSHGMVATTAAGNSQSPANHILATDGAGGTAPYSSGVANTGMAANMIGASGGSQPHNNLPPYLCLNFVIALQGIYPSRN